METVTHSAPPNPEGHKADRARAERIAAAVLAAIMARTPMRPCGLNVMTTAVYYWLAPEIPISAGEREIARAARGIMGDAITNATARLIASESTPVDPIGEAAGELARFVEAHEEEMLETFAAMYGAALNYQLAAVDWQQIATTFLGFETEFSREVLRQRIIADVLAIFAEMDEIAAAQRAAEQAEQSQP